MAKSLVSSVKDLVTDVFAKNTGTFRNTVAILFVFGLEAVTNEKIFKCPDKGHAAYGWMFILVPGLILFLLSLLLTEGFVTVTQGCCHTDDPSKQVVRKWCPCSCPRWWCSVELFKVFFYGIVASCLWVFWAFLQKEYYTCAVMGSKEQLKNATGEAKTKLEQGFADAEKTSQVYGFTIVTVILGVPVVVLAAYRCCYQRPVSSIPSLGEYEKLEAKSAGETLKTKIETYATEQGKGKAERYFFEKIKAEKNPSDIIREAYNDLKSIERYSKAIGSLDNYKKDEADAVKEEFKKKAKELGTERVTLTFKDKAWREYEDDDPYDFVEGVYDSMKDEYPRVTGDRSKPYKKGPVKYKQLGKGGDIEMAERHDAEA